MKLTPTARPLDVNIGGYYDDEVLLAEQAAWTWTEVPTVPYALRSQHERRDAGWAASMAVTRLKQGRLHWKIRPHSTASTTSLGGWAPTRAEHVARYGAPSERYPDLLGQANGRMLEQQPHGKQTFLGVELGKRNAVAQIRDRMPTSDAPVNERERERWARAAEDKRDSLSRGALAARPLDARSLRQLRQHTAYRGLEVPTPSRTGRRLFGHRETIDEFLGVQWDPVVFPTLQGARTCLAVTGPASPDPIYTATWVVAVMPETMSFPSTPPWLSHADGLPFPVEVDALLELVPPKRAARRIKGRLNVAREQDKDATFAGADLPIETAEVMRLAREWEYRIPRDRRPMVWGHVLIRAEADTPEGLVPLFEQAEERYGELGIDLAWPGGMSQADLLRASIPGGPWNFKSYRQMWPVETVGCGLPHAGSGLAHPTGLYAGVTTGRIRQVVTWDPHWAIRRSAEQGDQHIEAQGGAVLLGAQRSGKSNAIATVAYDHAEAGITTVLVDFGGEQARLQALAPDRIEVFDVLKAGGGAADPMSSTVVPGDPSNPKVRSARERLTMQTLGMLAFQQVRSDADAANGLRQAIVRVAGSAHPSTAAVLEDLRKSNDRATRNLGEALYFDLSTTAEGAVILGEGGAAVARTAEKPLTVITGKGFVMAEAGKPLVDWTSDELLSGAVFSIVGYRARRLLWELPPDELKLMLMDEAHIPLATPAGKAVVSDLLRAGPKYGVATVLATHNAAAVSETWLANSISTWMLFRSSSEDELAQGLNLARIENTRANRDLRRGLRNGECLMVLPGDERDRMRWDRWHPGLRDAANTTAGRRPSLTKQAA